ncbi:hypothetical protein ACVBEJ_07155 [Porticoccus sp. GXU_MW_L64]
MASLALNPFNKKPTCFYGSEKSFTDDNVKTSVIPAQAGIHMRYGTKTLQYGGFWISACAGMTGQEVLSPIDLIKITTNIELQP